MSRSLMCAACILALSAACLSADHTVHSFGVIGDTPGLRVAIVKLAAQPYEDTRLVKSLTETEQIRCLTAQVDEKAVQSVPGTLTLMRFERLKPTVEQLGGRFVLVFQQPALIAGYHSLLIPHEGDAQPYLAIPVGESFHLEPTDTPRVASYRALATFWQELSPQVFVETLRDKMPSLERYEGHETANGTALRFPPDIRRIADLVDGLDPLRRMVMFSKLMRAKYCEAEQPLEEALWAARNDPDIDKVGTPASLWIQTIRRGPEHMPTDMEMYLSKAEQCAVDCVRASYVGSLTGGGWDKARLARLLPSSGPRSQGAIVLLLGYYTKDTAWQFHRLATLEERERRLPEFVAHWKQVYGVGGEESPRDP